MNTKRGARRFFVVGITGVAVFFILPSNGAGQGILQLLLNVALVGALVVGIRRGRPERAAGWWTMTVGAAVYLVANSIWFADPIGYGGPLSFPSVADWCFIAAYTLIAAGLFMLGWRRRRALDATLDAFLCCIGLGVLSWWVLINRAWHQTALTPVQVVGSVAPPLIDLVILFAAIRMLLVAYRRGPAVWLLAGGVATQLVADTWMGFAQLNGTFKFGQPFFAGWLIFFVLTGTAASHPTMRNISDDADHEHVGTGRIVVVVAATLVPIAIGLFGKAPDERVDVMILWSVAGEMILVATIRLGIALRRVAAQRGELAIANAGLAVAEERYRLIFQNAMEGIFQIDADGIVVTANPAFAAIAGWESSQQLVGSHLQASSFLYEQADAAVLARMLEGSRLEGRELRLRRRDGTPVWVAANVRLVDDETGVIRAEGSVVDVTAKMHAQEALEQSEAGFREMFASNPHAMWVYDRATLRFLEVNQAAVDRYGFTRDEFLSMRIVDIRPPEEVPELLASIDHDLDPKRTWHHIAKDGRRYEVEVASRATSFHRHSARLVVAYDVTERNNYQRELEHAAFHDGLTGLANRALLLDRLTTALARAKRSGEQVGLIYLDLDNFKVINDSLGHAPGDEVIVGLARRFADAMRAGDTVARIGGDEFVILCEGIEGLHEAIEIMRRLRHVLAPAMFAGGRELYVTASAGIATSDGSVDAETMLRRADAAMYSAKRAGPDRYVVFEDRMLTATLHRFDVEAALRSAVTAEEFVLYYQPKVRLDDGSLVGVEALIRWQRPGNGLVPPTDFIPVAEATGLIVPIGTWVIREALRQYRAWGLDPDQPVPLTIAVNVSAAQLERADFLDTVRDALRVQGLPPRVLLLEVTESAVMSDVDRFREALVALKALGVGVSIDDFGSGYSSLSRVRRFPAVDELKIDRSFIRELSVFQGIAVVKAIVALGHTIGSTVTAEGIEHEREATLLRDIGCDVAQGFLYSAPQPADVIAPMLEVLPAVEERKLPARRGGGRSVTPRDRARARSPLPRGDASAAR